MHFKHWGSDSDSAKEQSGICPLGVTEQLEELSGDIPWLHIRDFPSESLAYFGFWK